ncbi:hypothetical protein BGX24_009711 [Mortierella sp. AD032]|nr:hypothetical protein BGX24_009711 [Mortierella sp. AD032]
MSLWPLKSPTPLALTGYDPKMDAKNSMPLAITDEMSGLEYDPHRMSAAIYSAIQYPVDALVVSIPDIDVLREPLLAARKKNIPIIAVYSGLQAAKDLDILAIMSDDHEAGRLIGQQMVEDGKYNRLFFIILERIVDPARH